MNEISDFTPSPQKLIVTLLVGPDTGVHVRACEVLGQGVRNRISFTAEAHLFSVFKENFAEMLSDCIDGIGPDAGVLSLPDFKLQIPGFAVAGLHILISEVENKCRQVICRFRHFLGGLNAALRMNVGTTPTLATYQEKVVTDTIAEISLPLLNLCNYAEMFQSAELDADVTRAYLVKLNERRHELEFYTELLKRFVEDSAQRRINEANSEQLSHLRAPPVRTIEQSADIDA